MRSTSKLIGVGVGALLGGMIGGAWLDFHILASRHWRPMIRALSQSLASATGDQAYMVLTLLDKREEGKIRQMLEDEVDASIVSLSALQAEHPFDPSDPVAKQYERLKRYRAEHPRSGLISAPVGKHE